MCTYIYVNISTILKASGSVQETTSIFNHRTTSFKDNPKGKFLNLILSCMYMYNFYAHCHWQVKLPWYHHTMIL